MERREQVSPSLDAERFRFLYWLAVGEPAPEGDPVAEAPKVELPPFDEWLPIRSLSPVGTGPTWVHRVLERVPLEVLIPGLKDESEGLAVVSGLYQIHDYLEEAHRFAQRVDNRDGAYWHGIMHRREPDYSNARYWFRRVGDHPLFRPLGAAARAMIDASGVVLPTQVVDSRGCWDPFGFVSLCSQLEGRGRSDADEVAELARRLQGLEMKLLLAWTVSRAVE